MTLLTPRGWRRGAAGILRAASPSQPGATRTYTDWRRPTEENIDARVWSGIHTRTADEAGVRLGRDVAAHTVRNAARLLAR